MREKSSLNCIRWYGLHNIDIVYCILNLLPSISSEMRFDRLFVNRRFFLTKLLIFLWGIYIGLFSSNWMKGNIVFSRVNPCFLATTGNLSNANDLQVQPRTLSQELRTKQLIFVGIMTAEKFLNSRASVVYNTWGETLPGKLAFFVGNKTKQTRRDLPLVSLNGVDDSYPPQRKSLMMLKYMYDHYIDQFDWFMRSDDDVYVRTDKLEAFLRAFDSSDDLFIGQAGVGAREERGQLGLGATDNFCMGGPGVIMSRNVLKKLGPHLEHCLKHMISSHEDVEVGRCVKKHVGVSCTWSFEMQWLFYHNQSKHNAFHVDLDTKAVQSAITLHPVKDPKYMYRLHTHFLKQRIQILQHQSIVRASLLRRLKQHTAESPIVNRKFVKLKEVKDMYLNIPTNTTLPWEVFSPKRLFTTATSPPSVPVQDSIKRSLNVILRRSLALINQDSRRVIFRELVLSKVVLGYMRVIPSQGVQYILDLQMVAFQHLGYSRRQLPLNVHYTTHMQQAFGNLVYTSTQIATTKPYVHIILPLAGRLHAFATFLSNFEKVVLRNNEKVELLIMYFPDAAPFENHLKIVKIYQSHYPNFEVTWKTVQGPFSRGLALQLGVSHFSPNSLLFFCDVDLAFDVGFLDRCREHNVIGKRVYYPMVFSQFNQRFGNLSTFSSSLHGEKGFWRKYGFGIVCAYGQDVISVGGFDTKIQGWGLEDVKLYEQFVSSGRYDIIRAPDPGLIHIYHASVCSLDLEPSRLEMCRASARSQLASPRSLVDIIVDKGYF